MDQTDLTITLPLSAQQGQIILFALGIAVASVIVWVATETETRKPSPLALLKAFGWAMVPIWLLLFGGTLWQVWQMLSGGDTAFAGRQSLGAGALVAALLGAPFVVWGTVLKQRTVDFQQEGHITDRINKAVEQLGAEKTEKVYTMGDDNKPIQAERTVPAIEVRIGAILSLERIAQDSTRYDKGRDHVRVMEILCAYVRENSNARAPRDFPLPKWKSLKHDATDEERKLHIEARKDRFDDGPFRTPKARKWAKDLPKPRADIAQALLVLGRRTTDQRRVEAAWPNPPEEGIVWPFDLACPELPEVKDDAPQTVPEIDRFSEKLSAWRERLRTYSGYRLDLRGANLQGADLSAKRPDASDAVFSGALLNDVRMEGANLSWARMEGANISASRMEGGCLSGVRMDGANLALSQLEGAEITGAHMVGVVLDWSRLEGADLRQVRMAGANLSWSMMEFADFRDARMEGAKLVGSRMEGADFRKARIVGADLRWALMEGTDLGGVPLDINVII
ncbi:conserved membrane hypothetical protein [Roseovarius sp. EC-HK134]|nr:MULTISPECIES: pentapeptide repeat-containing protein [unclassified Roseovarius]VVT21726.1 conserved membrane hypothetical protein [Roseovarius sp. EC-HK134]